ncbi:stage V sporulation protein AB [Halobacillus sp. A5]|uniref:stage V sporulation protein AB n=1 Tax=Halobacillus sp. A5 TaxID=2880263 RepID=UPI0020A6C94E|nr:stage V sporulation protein AB [Halobacillus sp. A5]MCP3025797.1 stage V sporulation protein AB [Halobacillus sp. A5]
MRIIEALIGLASGIAVGTGFVAFITVLGIVPRLMQLSHTESKIIYYEAAIILGVFAGIYLSFGNHTMSVPVIGLVLWGVLHGMFVGMLAAALTEVLNVFPLLFKRIGIESYLFTLLMALSLGKIAGSLFQWVLFVK